MASLNQVRGGEPRLSEKARRRLSLVGFIAIELLGLALISFFLLQSELVEVGREAVGDVELVRYERQFIGKPVLYVLVLLAGLWPLAVKRLRRERVMLAVTQLSLVVLTMFVLWPLIQIFQEGFKAGPLAEGFTLSQFRRLLGMSMVVRATSNTLWLGTLSALLSTALGTVVAYALTLTDIPWKRWIRLLVVIPLISPPFAVSFALIMLFGRNGLITYRLLGITGWSIYGPDGIIFVQLVANMPLAALIMMAVFSSVSRDLEDAAEDLGARPISVLRTVTFPLVTPAIMTAALLNFIASISDFGNPMLIGAGFQLLAPQAFIQLIEFFDLQLGAALSMLLVVPALGAFAIQHWISNRRSYVTVTGGARTGHVRALPPYLKWPLFVFSLGLAAFSLLIYGSIFVGAAVETWGYDFTPTLRHLAGLSNSLPQLMNSLRVSAAAGIGGGVLGILLAWLVTRPQVPRRESIDFAGTLMYAIPGTVVGIGYIIAFNNEPFFWTGTFFIIIVAYAFRRLPVGLRTGVATEKQLDPSLEEASLDLGASRVRTFLQVSFPLLSRAFLAGVMYIFIKSMTDLSAAIFLVGGSTQVFTVRMFNVMIRGTLGQAAAMATLLIVIILVAMALLSRLTGKSFVEVFRI